MPLKGEWRAETREVGERVVRPVRAGSKSFKEAPSLRLRPELGAFSFVLRAQWQIRAPRRGPCATLAGMAREHVELCDTSGELADLAGSADHNMPGKMMDDGLDPAEAHRRRNRAQVEVLLYALGARYSTPEQWDRGGG